MKPGLAYDLLAIDLDGTLLDESHSLPARNRLALHAAHEAGLRIVLCTGRSFPETKPILEQIGLDLDATITVGGAVITEAATGRTLESIGIPPEIAREAFDWFEQRGYAVIWLTDSAAVGTDGYVTGGKRRHPAYDRWVALSPCQVTKVERLPDPPLPAVRLTIVDELGALDGLAVAFAATFDGRMTHNVIQVPAYRFVVLEAFAADVTKWSGIQRLCRRWEIDPGRTVTIGDDVNDVSMIRNAGLGVAVLNAVPAVKGAARLVVGSHHDGGVAELIEILLTGKAP